MKNNDPLFSIHYEQEPSRAKSTEKTDLQLQYEQESSTANSAQNFSLQYRD